MGVTATGSEPAAIARQVALLGERGARLLMYAMGLRQPVWDYQPAPHVVSVPVRLEFPWNRGEASAAEHAEAFGIELGDRLEEALTRGDDGVTDAQLAWYGAHARLGFELRLGSSVAGDAGELGLLLQR